MRAGELRHRITLLEAHENIDSAGQDTPNLVPYDSVWAKIEPLSMRQVALNQSTANTVITTATHKVTIRFNADISVNHQIRFGDRYFTINSITNVDEVNWEMDLTCTEVAQ